MLSKIATALAVALLALTAACAAPGAAPPLAGTSVSQGVDAGFTRVLHVEPFEIVYSRRKKGPAQPVRVWQKGFNGIYVVNNYCAGVTVSLQKYTDHNASIWNVRAKTARPQDCFVTFVGSGGPRGTNSLHIKMLR